MNLGYGVALTRRTNVRLAGGGGNPWGTRVADSSDSTLLSGQDAVVAVNDGSSYLYFGKTGGTWKLLWTDRTGALLRGNTTGTTAVTVASNGPSPFDVAYGLATDRKAGTVATGTTYSHTADCLVEWTQDAIGTNSPFAQTRLVFRRQDASNFWYISTGVPNNNTVAIVEVVAGVVTNRATYVQNATGLRVLLTAVGSEINVYLGGTLRLTYSSATNFATATAGRNGSELGTHTNGGTVSDLVAWPRTLTGTPASLLDQAVA